MGDHAAWFLTRGGRLERERKDGALRRGMGGYFYSDSWERSFGWILVFEIGEKGDGDGGWRMLIGQCEG